MLKRASAALALLAVACRSPTQITFDITTDVPCNQLGDTQVTAGALEVLDKGLPPTTTAPQCTLEGHVGSFVVVPSGGDDNAQVAVEIVAGVGESTNLCAADPTKCIVAKRALRFIPHTPLTVSVGLDSACAGVVCPGVETCVDGQCKSALIGDPGQCTGAGCSDTILPPVDGGAPVEAGAMDSGVDATLPTDASTVDAQVDSGSDVAVPPAGDASCNGTSTTPVVVTIGPTGNATATGLGQQRHLVVESGCQYHFFYPSDDGTKLLSRTSSDYANWADGDSLSLAVTAATLSLGQDFALAYAEINGTHVLHVLVEEIATGGTGNGAPQHLRTTITGGHFSAPTYYSLPNGGENTSCDTDGPSVLITADHRVYDATGWIQHNGTNCDLNVLGAAGVDDGKSFTGVFSLWGYEVSLPGYTYTHDLVELPSLGKILGAYPDQDSSGATPDDQSCAALAIVPSNEWDASYGAGAPAADEIWSGSNQQSWYVDWGLCRLSDTEVHAIRHVYPGTGTTTSAFQAQRYNGTAWATEGLPVPSTSDFATGLAVVSGLDPSKGMVLATIHAGGKALDLQQWSPALNGWTALASIPRTNAMTALTGSGCGSARPAFFWTEQTGSTYAVMSADVSGLLK
ncbi:MAG TPA: hypothetical protein VGI39_08565 [Polyangiaceae bacterium]|jgi:hypothetical protein